MLLVALIIGVVLIVAAIRGTQNVLFSALTTDVPGFVIWGAALLAVGAIGYIPGLKPVSRGLLALIIVAIVLNNYQAILSGFQASSSQLTSGNATQSTGSSSNSSNSTAIATLPEAVNFGNTLASVISS